MKRLCVGRTEGGQFEFFLLSSLLLIVYIPMDYIFSTLKLHNVYPIHIRWYYKLEGEEEREREET